MANTVTPQEALQHGADSCEQVAKAIQGIGQAARAILAGPLTVDATCILIREAMPRGTKSGVSEAMIRSVLQGAAALDGVHLKKAVR